MKNLKEVSKVTQIWQSLSGGQNIWVPLYYSYKKDAVYTNPGEDRELVTHLLNMVTPTQVEEIVKKWKWA